MSSNIFINKSNSEQNYFESEVKYFMHEYIKDNLENLITKEILNRGWFGWA